MRAAYLRPSRHVTEGAIDYHSDRAVVVADDAVADDAVADDA